MSSRGVGMKTGGKGSWRRKAKKTGNQANQAADKLWLAAQRAGCRDIGQIDSASIICAAEKDALSFNKPELALDMRANTYLLKGKPEKKPMAEILTEMLQSIAGGRFAQAAEDAKNELGDTENVEDFTKVEDEKKDE